MTTTDIYKNRRDYKKKKRNQAFCAVAVTTTYSISKPCSKPALRAVSLRILAYTETSSFWWLFKMNCNASFSETSLNISHVHEGILVSCESLRGAQQSDWNADWNSHHVLVDESDYEEDDKRAREQENYFQINTVTDKKQQNRLVRRARGE